MIKTGRYYSEDEPTWILEILTSSSEFTKIQWISENPSRSKFYKTSEIIAHLKRNKMRLSEIDAVAAILTHYPPEDHVDQQE